MMGMENKFYKKSIIFAIVLYVVVFIILFGSLNSKNNIRTITLANHSAKIVHAVAVNRAQVQKQILKGFIPVVLCSRYASHVLGADHGLAVSVVGLSALLGHQFSIFLSFRGGKGVGTAVGVYLAISPLSCLVALFLFLLIVYKWDFISLGSMASACAMPFLLAGFGKRPPLVIASFIIAAIICFKHNENIQRLLSGEERKWSDRKSQVSKSRSLSNSSSE